jgi:hypothetical protein
VTASQRTALPTRLSGIEAAYSAVEPELVKLRAQLG